MPPKHDARITIHMVSSIDGYISRHDEDVGWFNTEDSYEHGMSPEDAEKEAAAGLASIDCYVMGSRTYDLARRLGWIYGDTPTVVLTRRDLPKERETVEFYSGDLAALTDRLRKVYRDIWVIGGANVCTQFVRRGLADDVRLSILPIILGDGILFFERLAPSRPLHLKDAKAYHNGVVSLWYEIRRA
jgi:dihydrofolate reductase